MSDFKFDGAIPTEVIPNYDGNGQNLKVMTATNSDGVKVNKAPVLFTVVLTPTATLVPSNDIQGDVIQVVDNEDGGKSVYAMLLVDAESLRDNGSLLECILNTVVPTMFNGKVLVFDTPDWASEIQDINWNIFTDWEPENIEEFVSNQVAALFASDEQSGEEEVPAQDDASANPLTEWSKAVAMSAEQYNARHESSIA